jgi:hypothetical protein
MMALLQRTMVATMVMAALLAGCAAGQIGDTLPNSLGGLPQGAPARPNLGNRQYPAVHDMPPPRATDPLNETDQVKLEKELQAARDRQEAEAAKDAAPPAPPPPPPPAPAPAAKPAVKKQSDAAKTSGAKTNP